jgi:hypothetical protein
MGVLCAKGSGPSSCFTSPRAMLDIGGGRRVHAVACGSTSTFLCVADDNATLQASNRAHGRVDKLAGLRWRD